MNRKKGGRKDGRERGKGRTAKECMEGAAENYSGPQLQEYFHILTDD